MPGASGALIGLAFASGALLVAWRLPRSRKPGLEERLAPYVGDPELNRAVIQPGRRQPMTPSRVTAGGLAQELLRRAAGWLDAMLGGTPSIRRRLGALGIQQSVEAFRAEQVLWACAGLGTGVSLAAAIAAIRGGGNWLAAMALGGTGLVAGALGRDWWLTVALRRRAEILRAELPVVAELLALAVTAGESPAAALQRVCRVSQGALAMELAQTLAESRSGTGLATALEHLAARTTLEPLTRFVDGLVIALERGTPLAEVLRAQAADAREAGKRSLLATGGRREIAMMVPVVFLILPVTVLFALYPGLVSITMLTQ
jgi:tight adherence protein C